MLLKPTRVLAGVGIHSGLPARVQMRPLPTGHPPGIYFQREGEELLLHAHHRHVSNTALLKTELGHRFQTVEHVMASLFGLNVFHAVVVVGGESGEVPIMDGGCVDFCDALRDAGIAPVQSPPPFLRISKPQTVTGPSGSFCQLLPSTTNLLHVELSVEFTGCTERVEYVHDYGHVGTYFCDHVAPAKTFCMRPDVDRMRLMGLGLGGTADNCVVYEDDRTPSRGLHRAKHKLLDLLGDFALCGHARLVGKILAHRSGHALNHQAVAALLTTHP